MLKSKVLKWNAAFKSNSESVKKNFLPFSPSLLFLFFLCFFLAFPTVFGCKFRRHIVLLEINPSPHCELIHIDSKKSKFN